MVVDCRNAVQGRLGAAIELCVGLCRNAIVYVIHMY